MPGPDFVSVIIVADWPMTAPMTKPVSARPALTVMTGFAAEKRSWVLPALPVMTCGVVDRLSFVAVIGVALVNSVMLSGATVAATTPGLPRLNVGVFAPPSLTKVRLPNVCVRTLVTLAVPRA